MKYDYTIDNFLECLKIGHEIEFTFCGKWFFVQPDYKFNKNKIKEGKCDRRYILYQCESYADNNAKILLSGTLDEIISFPLNKQMTIKTNFDKFSLYCMF